MILTVHPKYPKKAAHLLLWAITAWFTVPGCWEDVFSDAVFFSSPAVSLYAVLVWCWSPCRVSEDICTAAGTQHFSVRGLATEQLWDLGSLVPAQHTAQNGLHSHQRLLSITELCWGLLPACVLAWDDLEKPVGPVVTVAGTVGAELPLPVGWLCRPTARPGGWSRRGGPGGPEAWTADGPPAAARGEQLVPVLRSQLSGEGSLRSAPAAAAATSGWLLHEGAVSVPRYFLRALAVFLWESCVE